MTRRLCLLKATICHSWRPNVTAKLESRCRQLDGGADSRASVDPRTANGRGELG